MNEIVCVTGANGFIGSWIVKLLLERGYHVRGMVRYPDDKQKNGHLEELEGAKERLTLVKGELLNYDSLLSGFSGCGGVFHTACPVPSGTSTNPEVELLDPAIKGTLNVLRACKDANIKRVVVTSSVVAVSADPNRAKETIVDENCWSNVDYLREFKHWYMVAKTLGEREAWEYAKENNLDMCVVCPAFVLGPLLQCTVNASSLALLKLLNGSMNSYEDSSYRIVDVRDVALAHVLVFEAPGATLGRYLCANVLTRKSDLIELLKALFPKYPYPTKSLGVEPPQTKISTKKLQDLGLTYTPLEKTIVDAVESLKEKGLLE